MEYKTVTLSVLTITISLVLAHIHVEARSCCPSEDDRKKFDFCFLSVGLSESACAETSHCILVDDDSDCPTKYPNNGLLKKSGDIVNEYCKLGCTSSVCGALTTLYNSDASEIVNGAVEQCTNACSSLCTKGSKTALQTA